MWNAVDLAKLDQPIENSLPVSVSSEVIVRDKIFVDALSPVDAHQRFDVIRRAIARLATLHVNDRAERALIGAPASCVEAGTQAKRATDMGEGKEWYWRTFHPRQIFHEVVARLQSVFGNVTQQSFEPVFDLAREHRDSQFTASVQAYGLAVQHRQAARDMKAANRHRNAGRTQRPRQIQCARILIRLHADKRH